MYVEHVVGVLGRFFGALKFLNFSFFFLFRITNIFGSTDILFGSPQNWTVFRGWGRGRDHVYVFRVFLKFKVKNVFSFLWRGGGA